jgi:hypothetical protein
MCIGHRLRARKATEEQREKQKRKERNEQKREKSTPYHTVAYNTRKHITIPIHNPTPSTSQFCTCTDTKKQVQVQQQTTRENNSTDPSNITEYACLTA